MLSAKQLNFRFNASEIGSLLGCFSRLQQFETLLKVWKKSGLAHPGESLRQGSNWQSYKLRRDLLASLGVQEEMKLLFQRAEHVVHQDQIGGIVHRGFELLFQNGVVQAEIAKAVHGSPPDVTERLMGLSSFAHYEASTSYLEGAGFNHPVLGVVLACQSELRSLRTALNCAYGKNAEALYIKEFAELMETAVTQPRTLMTRRVLGGQGSMDGRVDGYLDNGDLIEIKHRTGRGLARIPVYELIQVHCYMYICRKSHIKVVQCVRTTRATVSDTTVVYFSEVFWDKIMAGLARIIAFVSGFMDSGLLALRLLDAEGKKELMIRALPETPTVTEEEYAEMTTPPPAPAPTPPAP
jgi:hypothetical protein